MKKQIYACEKYNGNCMFCFYADICGYYNETDLSDIPQVEVEVDSVSMTLCEGRHAIPQAIDGAIFGNELDPLATTELEAEAYNKLKEMEIKTLNLYVTGLTVALVSVINACRKLNIKLTLWHYDRNTNGYYPQSVEV